MASRSDCVCGIEISKEHISIAQFSPIERTIENASLVIRPLDDEDSSVTDIFSLKNKVKKLVASMKAEGQTAVVSLPVDYSVIKKISLDRDEKNISDTIQWELSQQIIGSMDDYIFDTEPMADDGGELKHVLAVAYKNEYLQKHLALVKAGKLNPTIVDLDIFALVNVFEANYPDFVSVPAIIIHGKDENASVILTKDGKFVDYEIASYGAGLSSPESYADLLIETMAVLGESGGSCPIVCSGAAFSQPDFSEGVLSKLGNAQILNPFTVIPSKFNIPESDMQKCMPHFGVCVGLALRAIAEAGI